MSLTYNIQIVNDVEVTIGNYFPEVGNIAQLITSVTICFVTYTPNNHKIRRKVSLKAVRNIYKIMNLSIL